MSKVLRLISILAVVVATLLGTTAVFAQEGPDTHLYGSVFIDTNMNGVWDSGEKGYAAGTTVTLNPGDPDEIVKLQSAGTRVLAEGEKDPCTYLDWTTGEGDDVEINPYPLRPCEGTFGLRPAGPKEMVWEVTLTVPAGYMVTSANPQYVEITSDTPIVEFGIAPTGAGGPTAASIVILPVTGGTLLGLLAIAATLIGGGTLIVKAKSRR